LKYHGGNKEYSLPQEAATEFASLDTSLSKIKVVLLAQIGKEGWDCKSLTSVILPQKGACPQNMVLQTSCRCLRQVEKNTAETALIWLNEDNAKVLNKELAQQQHTSIEALNKAKVSPLHTLQRFSRMEKLRVPPIDFYQLKVSYQTLVAEEKLNTADELKKDTIIKKSDDILIKQQDLKGKITHKQIETVQDEEQHTPITFSSWLHLIAKESFAASGKIKYKLRDKLYGKIVRLGANYGEKVSISSVVQLFSEGIEQMEIYFSRYLPQFFYSLLAPLTLFAIICTFSIKTALVLMLCVPLIPLSIVAVQKFAKKLFSKYWGKYTKLGDDFYENLQGLTTLKIYNADERQQEKMNENAENFRKITMKVLVMQLNSVSLMDLIAYMGAALGVIFSLMELTAGKINVGQAFFIMMISSEFFIPLRILGSFFHIAMNGMSASDRLFAILDLEEDDKEKVSIEKFSDIEIKNLSFSYNSERKILKNITSTKITQVQTMVL